MSLSVIFFIIICCLFTLGTFEYSGEEILGRSGLVTQRLPVPAELFGQYPVHASRSPTLSWRNH